jgi:uncharacterized membrane protein YphA (DoxX/SURF4 family)
VEIAVTKSLTAIRKVVLSDRLCRIVSLLIGFVFIYAGAVKLTDPEAFARLIAQYDILPDTLLVPFAIGLPLLEFLAGCGLVFRLRSSLVVILILLVLFSSVLGYGIFNNLNIDCGCFSLEEVKGLSSLKQALYRDVVMIGAVLFLFLQRSWRLKRSRK